MNCFSSYVNLDYVLGSIKVTHPLGPPPFDKGGGSIFRRGASPLLDSLHIRCWFGGGIMGVKTILFLVYCLLRIAYVPGVPVRAR